MTRTSSSSATPPQPSSASPQQLATTPSLQPTSSTSSQKSTSQPLARTTRVDLTLTRPGGRPGTPLVYSITPSYPDKPTSVANLLKRLTPLLSSQSLSPRYTPVFTLNATGDALHLFAVFPNRDVYDSFKTEVDRLARGLNHDPHIWIADEVAGDGWTELSAEENQVAAKEAELERTGSVFRKRGPKPKSKESARSHSEYWAMVALEREGESTAEQGPSVGVGANGDGDRDGHEREPRVNVVVTCTTHRPPGLSVADAKLADAMYTLLLQPRYRDVKVASQRARWDQDGNLRTFEREWQSEWMQTGVTENERAMLEARECGCQ